MLEIGLGGLLKPALEGFVGWWRGRKGKLSAADVVQLRMKWNPEFESKIAERRKGALRKVVIIRDVARVDVYPHLNETAKGIS